MKTFLKRTLLFLLLLLPVPSFSFGSEPVVIGVPLPLSGKSKGDGLMMKNSFEMARKTINEKGGIHGRPLHVIYADDQGKEFIGEEIIKQLVVNSKAVMLTGGHTSGPTYAMAKVADKLDVPFLICTASADKITQQRWANIYRLNPPASEYTKGLEDFWIKNLKPESISIFFENSMFGINGATHIMEFCQDNGIEIRTTVGYSSEEHDPSYFRSIVAFQKEDPPSVIYMVSRLEDGVALVKAIRELKINSLLCGGAGGFTSHEFLNRTKKAADHLLTATLWSHELPYPGAKEYYDQYVKLYGSPPDYHGAEAYSALLVAADALKRAQSLNAEDIREALNATYLKTPFGLVKFYSYERFERQNTARTLVQQVIDNKFEIVWPSDVATTRFVLPSRTQPEREPASEQP